MADPGRVGFLSSPEAIHRRAARRSVCRVARALPRGLPRRGSTRTRALACALACALAGSPAYSLTATAAPAGGASPGAAPSPAPAATPSPAVAGALRAHLAHELRIAGSGSGVYVYDLTSNRLLFSERAAVAHPPASVEKLYTSTAALLHLGPAATLSTAVLGTGRLEPGGRWQGNLYLRGGGDPTFGSQAFVRSHYGGLGASVQTLAAALVRDGIRSVGGRIEGDESYFDSRRGEPSSNYAFDPYLEGSLSALAFNRGEDGSRSGPHAPAEYAAQQLAGALRADHVSVHGAVGAAVTPASAVALATVASPTLAQLLGLMLPPSDNFFAEMLLKGLGARFGGAGSTAAGAAVVRQSIAAALGLHPRIVDGSGLSASDLTSPEQVVRLLAYLHTSPLGHYITGALAVAGRDGTLQDRMLNSVATGRCRAKTGTLTGVSNLAGYCQSRGGDLIAFAFFNDGIAIEAAHAIQDNMAITLARY
ncbi:MAG: D-alanyl-D-alanine carboxypeptidase/D-alanyl-D-alanine-endopeptidase [Acidobacteriota bacterium]|nr:D-alanyl-D-alanine carboxypeptidase/D-alanyl-D-alanine-endopeptidase [Acidobacteriota bacterium]